MRVNVIRWYASARDRGIENVSDRELIEAAAVCLSLVAGGVGVVQVTPEPDAMDGLLRVFALFDMAALLGIIFGLFGLMLFGPPAVGRLALRYTTRKYEVRT